MNHPWITVWFNPRATIRRATDCGRKLDPFLVSAVWGLSAGVFFASVPAKILSSGKRPLIDGFSAVAAMLLMTGVIYMNGAVRAWGGKRIGGRATTGELSEAIALSLVPFIAWFVLGAIVQIWMRFAYGGGWPVKHQPSPFWAYPILGLSVGLLVWSGLLRRECILEVQGFSPAQGRKAFWIGMKRYLLLLAVLAVLLAVATMAVSLIFELFRAK